MNFNISSMTLDDLNSIKNILLSDFDDFWSYETLEDELKCSNSFFKVVKNDDNEIIGFAGFKVIIDEADIMNVVVKKIYRHIGIGSFLLDNLISYAKYLNLKIINLEVNESNSSAIYLYNKFGFEKLGIRKKYYNGINDAFIMSKKI